MNTNGSNNHKFHFHPFRAIVNAIKYAKAEKHRNFREQDHMLNHQEHWARIRTADLRALNTALGQESGSDCSEIIESQRRKNPRFAAVSDIFNGFRCARKFVSFFSLPCIVIYFPPVASVKISAPLFRSKKNAFNFGCRIDCAIRNENSVVLPPPVGPMVSVCPTAAGLSDTWNWNWYGVPWAVGNITSGPGPQSEFDIPRGADDIGTLIAAARDNILKVRGNVSKPGIIENHETLVAKLSWIGDTPNDAEIFLNSSTCSFNSDSLFAKTINNG